jgi:F420-dependent oxidoreductase-like protein
VGRVTISTEDGQLKFGFKVNPQGKTWHEILEIWRVADEMPVFESGWLPDHFYGVKTTTDPVSVVVDPEAPFLEGWTQLSALAQATNRLRFGTMMTAVSYRNPAVLAKMATTLDVISGGRLEFGIGSGSVDEEAHAYGLDWGSVGDRFDRLEEALEVIVGLLTKPTTTFRGRFYILDDAHCEPKSIQRPHMPIWIGGGGERRTLPIAARWAQGWNLSVGLHGDFAQKRDVLLSCCDAIGRDPSEIRMSAQLVLGPDPDASAVLDVVAKLEKEGADLVVLASPYQPQTITALGTALETLHGVSE